MRYVTHLGGARATVLPALVLTIVDSPHRVLGLALLLANASSHAAVQVLKRLVARPRPADASGQPLALVELPDPFSFPSGHAAAATSVALTSAVVEPISGLVLVPIALLVSVSRVTLKVHHASDVIAGVALGAGGAWLASIWLV